MMETHEPSNRPRLVTPTRIIVLIAISAFALLGVLLSAWLSRPSTLNVDITAPVGETVVCHVVVDGRAESYEDLVPVTYHFDAHDLAFAVVCIDPTAADVEVTWSSHTGSGGATVGAGVKGSYVGHWWGSFWKFETMTATHVATMRTSVAQGEKQSGGNEEQHP